MRFYSALVFSFLLSIKAADDIKATHNFDIKPLDIKSLDADAPMNVILMKKPGVSSATVYPMSLQVTTEIKGYNIVSGLMTKQQYQNILNDKNSAWTIEPDGVVTALGGIEERASLRRNLAEDTPYGIPMVLQDIDFWSGLGTPRGSIKVCVADTGYDLGHVDLPNGSDVTGTNNPVYTVNDPSQTWDNDGSSHGTHCSGTVAALGGNNQGVVGVIPNNAGGKFQLVIGKALQNSGSGSWIGVIKAVELCIADGAKVISMSLGGGYSDSMETAFKTMYEEQDILLIAAAGNGGNSIKSYPASYGTVMSVAAVDSNEIKAYFSQFNDQVEISAPGVGTNSTVPGGNFGTKSGTSMATPHVAAVAGLLWMHFPECKNYQIRNAILKTAKDKGDSDCDAEYGYGLVQAKDAYELLAQGNCGGDIGVSDPSGGCGQLYGCQSDSDCDDGDQCTTDTCNNRICSNTLVCADCGKSEVKVNITTDTYGYETFYDIKDSSGIKVMEGAGFANNANRVDTKCFDNGSYTFTISDTYGDGICCTQGIGSYSVKVNDAEVASGGEFLYSESKDFSVSNTSPTNAPNPVPSNTPNPVPTNAPNPVPSSAPITVPTMYPTHTAPTPYPTEVPPTPYPTGKQCSVMGGECKRHSHCCSKKCNKIKGFCRQ